MKERSISSYIALIIPVLVYYLFYNICAALLISIMPPELGQLWPLTISGFLTLIIIYSMFRQLPVGQTKIFLFDKESLKGDIIYVLLGLAFCLILNVMLTQSGFVLYTSEGFASVNETLNDGSMFIKVLGTVIVIPILEEILFRGIIVGQLKNYKTNAAITIVVSALAFGASHHNIVQFVFAFLCGCVLAYIYYKRGRLWMPIFTHALANLISIIFF